MASIPGARFDISGASGSQGLLAPKSSWKAYFLPRGAYAAQDSTGTRITFDSAATASRFTVGDWIQAGLLTSNIRQVGAVGGTSITVSGAALTVAENDRIFLIGRTEPTVSGGSATYSTPNTVIRQRDDDAAALYTNSMVTTNANGLVQAFGTPALYDLLVQDGNRSLQGSLVDLPIGVPEGISVSDAAFFGSTVTIKVGPSGIAHAEAFAVGSSTNGIQEACDYFQGRPGYIMCAAGATYSNTKKVWLHSGITLLLNGANILRATGSIVNGDSNSSGDVIGAGPYGSNGTDFSSGSQGRDISIIGPGTISGNSTAFQGLTNTSLALTGIHFLWVNRPTIVNVTVTDTLQDAIYLSNCSSIRGAGWRFERVGMWNTVASRNGFSLMNNDNDTTNTNGGAIAGIVMKSVGDEAIACSGLQGMNVSGIDVDGCDFGIEFTSASTVASKDNGFYGGVWRNGVDFGFTFNATAADVTNTKFAGHVFDFHPTAHDAGVIYLSSSTHNVFDVTYSDISATNVNSLDATSRNWIDCQAGTAGKARRRLKFLNMQFQGLSSSVRTGDVGANFRGLCSDIELTGRLQYVPGIGFSMDDSGNDLQDAFKVNLAVDGANFHPFQLRNNGSSASITEIQFNGCVAKDGCRQGTSSNGANAGWHVEASVGGSTISNIYWNGCRAFIGSTLSGVSNQLYGINFQQSAGAMTGLFINGSDFTGNSINWFGSSGSPTNVHFRPPPGLGTAIASSGTITIPPDGSAFSVTGGISISSLAFNPWDNGRTAKLIFATGTSVTSPLGNAKIGGTFAASANYSLTLTGSSSGWNEDCRSANA